MTKREEFGLVFLKKQDPNDESVWFTCDWKNINYNALQILTHLSVREAEGLKSEINLALNNKTYEEGNWTSDGIDSFSDTLELNYPNVHIRDILIISMKDMKQLLEEWIEFCNS